MRSPTLLFTSLIFAILWVGGTYLRTIFTERFDLVWILACLFTGTVAAISGIFAYRWWNKL